jgi:hypothetical protein
MPTCSQLSVWFRCNSEVTGSAPPKPNGHQAIDGQNTTASLRRARCGSHARAMMR